MLTETKRKFNTTKEDLIDFSEIKAKRAKIELSPNNNINVTFYIKNANKYLRLIADYYETVAKFDEMLGNRVNCSPQLGYLGFLPNEILCKIFEMLGVKDLIQLKFTNKSIHIDQNIWKEEYHRTSIASILKIDEIITIELLPNNIYELLTISARREFSNRVNAKGLGFMRMDIMGSKFGFSLSIGEWSNQTLNGFGIMYTQSSYGFEDKKTIQHIGYFCNDVLKVGVVTVNDDYKYIGTFDNGKLSGDNCRFEFSRNNNIQKFVGRFINNKMSCGVMTWNDGSSYKGSFFGKNSNNFGTYKSGKIKYTGNWYNYKANGLGRLTIDGVEYYSNFNCGNSLDTTTTIEINVVEPLPFI